MIMGMMAGQMRAAVGGGGLPWTPLNMAAVPQIYLDVQESVVTNVSGACSAISNLGAMGAGGDFVQATGDNRPAILEAELNGKRVLRFDGTNDHLTGDTAQHKNLFVGASAAWSFAVYKKRIADGADLPRIILNTADSNAATRFSHWAGGVTTGAKNKPAIGARRVDGGAFVVFVDASERSAAFVMSLAWVDLAAGVSQIYANGSLTVNDTTSIGVGTFGAAATAPSTIGARFVGAAWASDMDLAALVVGNTSPSVGDRQKMEGWAAHKYGLTASLPGGHPYKTVAPTI